MKTTQSADGTQIAYDELGEGPAVIMLAGAFNDRATTAPLAAALAPRFTVLNCDRRGRGDSGDTQPYAVEREIEDIAALLDAAGGSASLFGYSSGAVLALEAAAAGVPIDKLALYEPPFIVDDTRPRPPADLPEQVAALVEADRRGDAVELYQTKAIGLPEEVVVQLRNAPFRPGLEAIAHTLVYDAILTRDLTPTTERFGKVTEPTLVLGGGESWEFLRNGADALAEVLPNAERRTLPGESHDINPEATAEALGEFLA
ncbi:MAG TPA: alpha/beta hydrolase [Thermoleophilaceae bacterium]|jgi:pimeloyl-ACP methyl ester carboxylesterase